jgi:hypothetical protein
VFQITKHIWARITPRDLISLYFLDFVDENGSRIEKRTGLVVYDGQECDPGRFAMEPIGMDLFTRFGNRSLYPPSRMEI